MPKPIKWTEKANESFEQNIDYLRREWSSSEVSTFVKQTMETIEVISAFPASFVQEKNYGFRKARKNRIISLILLEKEEHIELLFFWNNRKSPTGLFY